MNRKANPTLIGAFVLGAMALAVVAVLAFGSDRFFKDTKAYVVFFEGSVKGLDIGAPVSFRGVRVGSVRDVVLMTNRESAQIDIKVIVEIEEQKTEEQSTGSPNHEAFERLMKQGLRAKLDTQSMLTGKLYVDLDFYPETEMRLTGMDKSYPEIPAVPTDMQRLQRTFWTAIDEIRALPVQEIFDNLNQTLAGLNHVVNDSKAREILTSLEAAIRDVQSMAQSLNVQIDQVGSGLGSTLEETRDLVQSVNQHVDPIASEMQGTVVAARSAMENVDRFLSFKDERSANLINGMTEATTAAKQALEQANRTLAQYESLASQDSRLYVELTQALEELGTAARSLRTLSDYLERHPEALIQGKDEQGGY